MKKYEVLVSEWNTLSIIVGISVGFAMLGLVISLIKSHPVGIALTLAIMIALSVFEYKSREIYVESREYLENELFKAAGMKSPKIREVITKGAIKRR